MKIASVLLDDEIRIAWSSKESEWLVVEPGKALPMLRSVKSLIENWATLSPQRLKENSRSFDIATAKFLCPLNAVEKIICVGKNYLEHAIEMGGEKPELPVIFNKLPTCLLGPDEAIVLPEISGQVDYEAELVVVIGKGGRHIQKANALSHIFGYTIGNDVSARDWQKGKPGGQWLLGKAFDTFAPLGPYLVTADSIEDPHQLDIELRLNGSVMQNGSTSQLIFRIDELISHVSKFFTLKTGDLLFTGTPAGVGAGRNPVVFLKDGDNVEISISEIGTLSNKVDGRSG